jgi:hypothetical protein
MNKLNISLLLFFIQLSAFAQSAEGENGLATTMRSNGKIYVVVAVALTVMIGLIAYLISVDRKISKLEKSLKK